MLKLKNEITMETKHTKGEWINCGYRVDVDIADGLSGICEMSDWMNKSEMEANAKLIAAAPELLEACIEFVRKVECGQAKSTKSYSQMKKAIEKATK